MNWVEGGKRTFKIYAAVSFVVAIVTAGWLISSVIVSEKDAIGCYGSTKEKLVKPWCAAGWKDYSTPPQVVTQKANIEKFEIVGISVGIWAGLCAFLYLAGASIRYIARGFKAP